MITALHLCSAPKLGAQLGGVCGRPPARPVRHSRHRGPQLHCTVRMQMCWHKHRLRRCARLHGCVPVYKGQRSTPRRILTTTFPEVQEDKPRRELHARIKGLLCTRILKALTVILERTVVRV